jgi:enoyl-CoA hydratase
MTHPEGEILCEQREHMLVISINRPAKLNGFTPKMMAELAAAYTKLEDEHELRCAVLCARGDHFTAGLDLPSMAPFMRTGTSPIPDDAIDPFDLRATSSGRRRIKPVVAAVKGITYTLGIELMLAADIVIAAADCRFSQLEVKRGIMATGGATVRMAERAGMGSAMLHLLTGDEFGAEEALRMGFVQRIVPAGSELDAAVAVAVRICAQAPLALYETRASVIEAFEHGPTAAIAKFRDVQQRLANSEDAKEGVLSFVERRAARFTGH